MPHATTEVVIGSAGMPIPTTARYSARPSHSYVNYISILVFSRQQRNSAQGGLGTGLRFPSEYPPRP